MDGKRRSRLVDEPCGAELGGVSMTENVVEISLVVIEALFVVVVHGTYIDDDIACVEEGRISCADDICTS